MTKLHSDKRSKKQHLISCACQQRWAIKIFKTPNVPQIGTLGEGVYLSKYACFSMYLMFCGTMNAKYKKRLQYIF